MDNHVELEAGVESIELDGPFSTGTTGRTRAGDFAQEWELTDVVEGLRFGITGYTPDRRGTLTFSWEFEEEGDATRIHYRIEAQGPDVDRHSEVFRQMELNAPKGLATLVSALEDFAGRNEAMADSSLGDAPLIRTDRLWLTAFTMDDAEAVFRYASIPEVSRFTTWTPHTGIGDAEDFLRYALGVRYCWAIRLSADGSVIGAVECTEERQGENSIHYVLSPDFWGEGIMTEAAGAVVDWAFGSRPDVEWITTTVVTEHAASRRVLEKCGMEYAGDVLETWEKFPDPVRLARYRLSRRAWRGHTS